MKLNLKSVFGELGISFISAIVYLLVFSFSTSPIYFYSANDSAVYILLGKYLKDGLTMYTDFFEHKGPIIFFIEWVGSIICEGRTGAFIVQIVFMTFTIWGIYRLAKLFCDNKKSIVVVIISLLALNTFYEGGNLTEEFCLPVIILSLGIITKFLKEDDVEKYNYKYAIIHGITFTYCAFIRLTNALPICVFVFILVVYLIKENKWLELIKSVIAFIIGILCVSVPIFIYCAFNGIIGDMLYCTFLYNFMYVAKGIDSDETIAIMRYMYLIPLLVICLIGIVQYIKKENRMIASALILSGFCSILLQMKGRFYLHYLIMWIPVFAIMTAVIIAEKIDRKKMINISSIIFLFGVLWILAKNAVVVGKDINTVINDKSLISVKQESIEIVEDIEDKDKDRVLAYNTNLLFYLFTDIDPCYKIYTYQDWLGISDENVRTEFRDYLKSGKAKYIVTGKKSLNEKSIIESKYALIKETENMKLYQLNE